MNRRTFLHSSIAASATYAFNNTAHAQDATQRTFAPQAGDWRSFEIKHSVRLPATVANATPARLWLPIPMVEDGYQRNLDSRWTVSSGTFGRLDESRYGAAMLAVEFDRRDTAPQAELITRVQTQSRRVDLAAKNDAPLLVNTLANSSATLSASLSDTERAKWLAATDLMPTDGIVREKALAAIASANAQSDVDKVRALYQWTIANTYRNVDTRGCGVGDVKAALESSNFGGKCADINAIFVAMCRAAGIPARDVYGVRLAPSRFGYKELGAGSTNITKAQHCRAEVFLTGLGWVPMDPADVTKVQRLETKDWLKTTNHPVVAPVHTALFGAWEGNWLAYNVAHDVSLPGARGPKVPFFMYPHAETADGRADPYDPDTFKYAISVREI